ncbi:MAG TPA: VOC family protein [Flavitalea sp.]|nr:VOC family protein [Flavitalea sp.]
MATKSVKLIPYLTFDGNCEEALTFYKGIFGGEINVVNRYDNPAMNAPKEYWNKILHARLEFNGAAIYASDTFPGKTTRKNSGDVSLSLILHDLEKANQAFTSLAEGGRIHFPFGKQFWGDWHGSLTDRYGFNWNINFEEGTDV